MKAGTSLNPRVITALSRHLCEVANSERWVPPMVVALFIPESILKCLSRTGDSDLCFYQLSAEIDYE
jgi:hypothetical protein